MFRVVLVDDEPLVLNLLERMMSERADINIVGKYIDPEKALEEIPKLGPDVVFLDIDMPELSGIELGTKLLEVVENKKMEIVFVTAYEQYAIHAFKLNAIHYILKPADTASIDEVIKRIYQKNKIDPPKVSGKGEINLLGHMHLRVNGQSLDFLTAKSEELLALLIINREKGISKWQIIDVLWEEASMDKSQQNLHTMIFRLKKKLRDAGIDVEIKYKNSIYAMDLKEVHCDLKEFDAFIGKKITIKEGNLPEFQKAISLYKGDLLAEKDYSWCVFDREKYYQVFFNIIMSVAAYYKKHKQLKLLDQLYYETRPLLIEEDYKLVKSGLVKH